MSDMMIGNTPMIRLRKIEKRHSLECRLYAKAELMNPGGSIKDRAALALIKDKERSRELTRGKRIVEATSGNLGIAIAMLSAKRGYKATIVMPEGASEERKKLIKAYGAEVLTVGDNMRQTIEYAEELLRADKETVSLNQFTTRAGVECHYHGTGSEIWRNMKSKVDIFLAGVGTGATIHGVGKILKEKNKSTRVIAVEPSESALLSGGSAGKHGIDGIGPGFIPPLYPASLVDVAVTVTTDEALSFTRELAHTEGIFAGISSGASLAAAVRVGKREENKDKNIVFILCDRGERYFSRGIID